MRIASEIGPFPVKGKQSPASGSSSRLRMPTPVAIGHRVVHGGPKLRQHCLIDEFGLAQFDAASAFAPLHIPLALSVIRFAQEHFWEFRRLRVSTPPFMPVCRMSHASFRSLRSCSRKVFSATAFTAFPVNRSCINLQRSADRLVIAHLGNGASVTAVKGGKSIDTSMGLTPSGGVIMGTRSGELDPGVLIYLMREKKFDAARLEDLVDHRSGLLGISGIGSDMRRLHEAAFKRRRATGYRYVLLFGP